MDLVCRFGTGDYWAATPGPMDERADGCMSDEGTIEPWPRRLRGGTTTGIRWSLVTSTRRWDRRLTTTPVGDKTGIHRAAAAGPVSTWTARVSDLPIRC